LDLAALELYPLYIHAKYAPIARDTRSLVGPARLPKRTGIDVEHELERMGGIARGTQKKKK